ncbi:RnfABCDGE type electron transport complex subunit G [Clostridium sp. CX1]|uniref:RnfABCDGE type electron transport complex subunit G n=1 Tax=Clostridium sp. CX1 TaxID=2978346 RepID=UPI0021C1C7C6|nr:RnfABCDGE type electron transport complex subunit G [Clostridium sp. CX1]MCT8975997.1 RnfABCDGE type electron transport complex subunit G [Clostridium sp. CX1]
MKIFKLALRLFIVAGMAGAILGAAHAVTEKPIAEQQKKANSEAMKLILPKAEQFNKLEISPKGDVIEVNEGKSSEKTEGYAIKVTPKGYAGAITMMVGVSTDGKVQGIKILSHSETPGLGANATEPAFSDQYKDKATDKALEVVKRPVASENEIQAITGSTITSKAVTKGVNEAVEYYKSELKGGQK